MTYLCTVFPDHPDLWGELYTRTWLTYVLYFQTILICKVNCTQGHDLPVYCISRPSWSIRWTVHQDMTYLCTVFPDHTDLQGELYTRTWLTYVLYFQTIQCTPGDALPVYCISRPSWSFRWTAHQEMSYLCTVFPDHPLYVLWWLTCVLYFQAILICKVNCTWGDVLPVYCISRLSTVHQVITYLCAVFPGHPDLPGTDCVIKCWLTCMLYFQAILTCLVQIVRSSVDWLVCCTSRPSWSAWRRPSMTRWWCSYRNGD